jgi:hypothetical protein
VARRRRNNVRGHRRVKRLRVEDVEREAGSRESLLQGIYESIERSLFIQLKRFHQKPEVDAVVASRHPGVARTGDV